MKTTLVIMADRMVLPFRISSRKTECHPSVQIRNVKSKISKLFDCTFAIVGFSKNDVLDDIHDILYISNPVSSVERLPNSIVHALGIIPAGSDLFFVESDSIIESEDVEFVLEKAESCILDCPSTLNPGRSLTNLFVTASDRKSITKMLEENKDSFENARNKIEIVFPVRQLRAVRVFPQVAVADEDQLKSPEFHLAFDQQ